MNNLKPCKCDNYESISSKYGEFIVHRIDYDKFQIADGLTSREEEIIFKYCPYCGGILDIERYRESFHNNSKMCFIQDDCCHWYCIPVGKKDAFNKWVESMENDDDYDENFEDYRLKKHVSNYSFENMEEI